MWSYPKTFILYAHVFFIEMQPYATFKGSLCEIWGTFISINTENMLFISVFLLVYNYLPLGIIVFL